MTDKKMRYTIGQVANLCGMNRQTVKRHYGDGKIRYGKPNALGYIEFPRNAVKLYLWQTHTKDLEELEGEE